MSGYVPRPGGERRIVRRSSVMKAVARSHPRAIVQRRTGPPQRARTVGRVHRLGRSLRGGLRAARASLRSLRVLTHPGRGTLRLSLVLALLGVVGAGSGWLWQSPALEVKRVKVEGVATLSAEDLATLSGLAGEHMVTADLGRAQRKLAALPLVHSVHAERHWPNTVVLEVVERRSWATWEQAGVKYAIDREGVVLGPVTAAPRGRPFVVSAEPLSLRQGDRVSYQAVDAVAEIYELLPQELGKGILQVAFVPAKGVEVVTDKGQVALLGDSSSIRYKLAVWAAAEKEALRERINYQVIDLRWGNRPVLY